MLLTIVQSAASGAAPRQDKHMAIRIDSPWPRPYINNPLVINFMPSSLPTCSPATTSPSRRERRKEARPRELLDAALDLFIEKGFAATRAEEVAKLAGVSKGTLFLYYSSKEALFKAVVRESISSRFAEWGAELERFQGSSPDLLRHCVHTWWTHIGATKAAGISKLMMSEARNFPELAAFYQQEVIQPGNALIERVLQRGMDRGEFRPIDLRYGVYVVMAPILFLAMWKHSWGHCCEAPTQLVPEDYLAIQLDNILNGLRVVHPHAGGPTAKGPESTDTAG